MSEQPIYSIVQYSWVFRLAEWSVRHIHEYNLPYRENRDGSVEASEIVGVDVRIYHRWEDAGGYNVCHSSVGEGMRNTSYWTTKHPSWDPTPPTNSVMFSMTEAILEPFVFWRMDHCTGYHKGAVSLIEPPEFTGSVDHQPDSLIPHRIIPFAALQPQVWSAHLVHPYEPAIFDEHDLLLVTTLFFKRKFYSAEVARVYQGGRYHHEEHL